MEQEKKQKQTTERRFREMEGSQPAQQCQLSQLERTVEILQQEIKKSRSPESCDWVISRDEVKVSTKEELGRGAWGKIVKGTFRGTTVAVKQIHENILQEPVRILFQREMSMASRCRHPCLLQFIGATNDDRNPLLITELMQTNLRAVMVSLTSQEILVISMDVARALNYLHLNKPPIIHRDISSANVLLWKQGQDWRAKVSDYGSANFLRQLMTKAPGAPLYSAPEASTSIQSPKVDLQVTVFSFIKLLI